MRVLDSLATREGLRRHPEVPVDNVVTDRRRFRRVRIRLAGRLLLPDREEYLCQSIDVSVGGVALSCAAGDSAYRDDRVIIYLEIIGRLEGRIARLFDGGFAVETASSIAKREKIVGKLTWLANKTSLNLTDGRQHRRFEPKTEQSVLTLPDGSAARCRVLDISASGAAIATQERPEAGTSVHLGTIESRVVRTTSSGIIVVFSTIQDEDSIDERLQV